MNRKFNSELSNILEKERRMSQYIYVLIMSFYSGALMSWGLDDLVTTTSLPGPETVNRDRLGFPGAQW